MITKRKVIKKFERLKKITVFYMSIKNYDKAIEYLVAACRLMYRYNVKFQDNELELILEQLSNKIFALEKPKKTVKNKTLENNTKILFYDYFALDNRGLTMIYLKALISLGHEVLYVTYLENKKNNMIEINKLIESSDKISCLKISGVNPIGKMKELNRVISKYEPTKILIQTTPDDIVGLSVLHLYKNRAERFLINITDHAFWLGTSAIDYFIVICSHGYNMTTKFRKFNKKNCFVLPFYPNQNENNVFKGLPFNLENKKLIFSGGSIYKIGNGKVYFRIIKYMLDKYPETVFLYAGNGDATLFKEFIKENAYEHRCYIVPERNDFCEIIKLSYFYLSTYPLSGGLMVQYSVSNKTIPLSLGRKENARDQMESLFLNARNNFTTFHSIKDLYEEIDNLFQDENYYQKRKKELNNLIISKDKFKKELERILFEHKSEFEPEDILINQNKENEFYFSKDNEKEYLAIFKGIKDRYLKIFFLFEYIKIFRTNTSENKIK